MNEPLNETLNIDQKDPIAQFQAWLAEAEKGEGINPNAVALATVTPDGGPDVRMVLLKAVDSSGFVFYTNSESRKGDELKANPRGALCFYWRSLRREVRIEGPVEKVSDADADAYFASRDRASQIGAWASKQSRPMSGRFEFKKRIAEYTARYGLGKVPRPAFWEGYRVKPARIEFWAERRFRLHDRVVYTRREDGWVSERLYP